MKWQGKRRSTNVKDLREPAKPVNIGGLAASAKKSIGESVAKGQYKKYGNSRVLSDKAAEMKKSKSATSQMTATKKTGKAQTFKKKAK